MKFFRDLNVGVGGDGDQERRVRREIANSNERRRMQSINAGFQSLRTLLPHHEGEKLSKVRTTFLHHNLSVRFRFRVVNCTGFCVRQGF